MNAASALDRDFLQIRHCLLDAAAALDRIDRAEGSSALRLDDRLVKLRQAARALGDGQADRAKRMQMLFSIPFDASWRDA